MLLHKPGVVPLRPLALGDIFEGSLKTMRRNPEATLGMALLVLLAFLLPSLLLSLGVQRLVELDITDRLAMSAVLSTLFSSVAILALSGFVIYVVSEAALGDRVSIGQTWQAVRGRLLSLLGVTMLTFVVVGGLAAVVGGLIFALVAGVGEAGGAVLGLVVILAAVPLFLWLAARVSLAPAAVVLERVGPLRGLSRSWQLSRGRAAWRILGITVLAGIVTVIFSTVIGLPIEFGTNQLLGLVGGDADLQITARTVVDHLLQIIVNSLVTPFSAGVTALLYLDQRIRREGLDLALLQAAQQRAAARRS